MRVETHAATAVSHQQFGVVVLLLGNKSQRIDKRHRLEKVVVGFEDGAVRAEFDNRLRARQRLHFAIQALLIAHEANEVVSFDAVLMPVSQRYQVQRAKGV